MDLNVFCSGRVVVECSFTDSNGKDVTTQILIDPDDSFSFLDDYCGNDNGLTLKDWILDKIGGIVSVENVVNYLNSRGFKYELELTSYD